MGIEGGGPRRPCASEKLNNIGNLPLHVSDRASQRWRRHSTARLLESRSWMMRRRRIARRPGSRAALAADLDGAAAVGATNFGAHHGLAQMWLYWATHKDEASYIPAESTPPCIRQRSMPAMPKMA